MRIYISADMEGCTGVTAPCQTISSEPEYAFGCQMECHDVASAVRGALAGGADEVLVNDSHDRMINLDIREFGPQVKLLSGTPKPLSMVQAVETCDGAFFVGYHAAAGTPLAILDHTISGRTVYSITLNGREVGETGINAAVCAECGVPVTLVTGDRAVCDEAVNLLGPDVVTAQVKTAHSRFAATCLPPDASSELIRQRAAEAVGKLIRGEISCPPSPQEFDLQITFHFTHKCDRAAILPCTERIGGRTVRVTGRGMAVMRRYAGTLISLGGQ